MHRMYRYGVKSKPVVAPSGLVRSAAHTDRLYLGIDNQTIRLTWEPGSLTPTGSVDKRLIYAVLTLTHS